MFMQRDLDSSLVDGNYGVSVESIMRCEDFKSNFARRLSNRYISRTPVASPRLEPTLKLPPVEVKKSSNTLINVVERTEPGSQLSRSTKEKNGVIVKPLVKETTQKSSMQYTEVTALNMEVETLRWQLAQTEGNRQMHIALLTQVVTFLNRVKEHIEQKTDLEKTNGSFRPLLPPTLNFLELPRSKSVLHVNEPLDYTLSTPKKISTRKISKSISNVNGNKDCAGLWKQSKISLNSENDTGYKITEEISRLITLANTVLSTKIPELACSNVECVNEVKLPDLDKTRNQTNSFMSLNSIVENSSHELSLQTNCNEDNTSNITIMDVTDGDTNTPIQDFIDSSFLKETTEDDFETVKIKDQVHDRSTRKTRSHSFTYNRTKISVGKKNEYNNVINFMEDESGFSSMSSFQEIGIPVISIIPPSPCKDMGYPDAPPKLLDDTTKWGAESLELDNQSVKVFWV